MEAEVSLTGYDVVILPSFAQVEAWRKRHAEARGTGLFLQAVTTFDAWIAELWELHGDGRAIVSSLQRQVLMHAAFETLGSAGAGVSAGGVKPGSGGGPDCLAGWGLGQLEARRSGEDAGLTISSGVIALAAKLVREAAGVPEFDRAVEAASARGAGGPGLPEGASEREAAVLAGVARYYELLEDAGLVEFGHAVACLAGCAGSVFPHGLRVLFAEAAPLSWIAERFVEACPMLAVEVRIAAGAVGVGPVPAALQLRFGFPSGRYAQPALVLDAVREALQLRGSAGAAGDALLARSREGTETSRDAAADGPGDAGRWAIQPRSSSPSIVVACADPLVLYGRIEEGLARLGARGCVQARVPFAATDFGGRFLALARVLEGAGPFADDLSDAVRPPFAGFGRWEALEIDRSLRADRIAERESRLAWLRAASDTFSQLEELAGDPEADILAGVFEQVAFTDPGRTEAWRAEQLAALSAVRSCAEAARAVGAGMGACLRVLEGAQVAVSYERVPEFASASTAPRGDAAAEGIPSSARHAAHAARLDDVPSGSCSEMGCARVTVCTQAVAAQMGAGSCDMLVLCDLTSEDYPVADRDDAAATLFGKLGLTRNDPALAEARRTFRALEELPTSQLVCVRPLNDWDGNPTYPAAVLQELVDAYREDATTEDDLDELFGLPAVLREGVLQRGEETLFANAAGASLGFRQPIAATVELRRRADAPSVGASLETGGPLASGGMTEGVGERHAAGASAAEARVALARASSGGGAPGAFSPSPSQVEVYLECPYKWFVQRRLDVKELDEGFGALERGTFAHAVLKEFYRRFAGGGHAKVDFSNIEEARSLMRAVAEEAEAAQRSCEPGSGRYVAASQMEQRELSACREQLVHYLDFEAAFLPGFHPAYLEYPIRQEDGVLYGGRPFVGVVDRVDVDDAGHAVIVDYKGSVGLAHELAGKNASNPGKVQTRMYARAVERACGLQVVGAVYVSYGKRQACAGAYDGRLLEAAHLPAMRHDRCACAPAHSAGQPAPASVFRLHEDAEPGAGEFAPDAEHADLLAVDDFSQLTFGELLDATEQLVAATVSRMEQGDVAPNPASPDACAFCPVAHCPKRGA